MFSHLAPGFREFDVPRWDYEVDTWCDWLADLGFSEIYGGTLPCRGKCQYEGCPGVMVVDGTR